MPLNNYDDMILNDRDSGAAPAAPAVEPATKYDAAVAAETQQQRSNIQASMNFAAEKEPSRMAKAMQMAREVGLDTGTVERNLEVVQKKQMIAGTDYDKMIKDTPGVAQFMEKPENAALARDDMEPMGKIDQAARELPKSSLLSFGEGATKFGSELHQAGEIGYNQLSSNLMGLRMMFDGADRETIERQAFMNKRAQELSEKRPEYAREFGEKMSEEFGDVTAAWKSFVGSYDKWKEGKTLEALTDMHVQPTMMVIEALDALRHMAARPRGLMFNVSEQAINALPSIGLGTAGAFTGPGAVVAVPAGVGVGSAITEIGATMTSVMAEKGYDVTDPDSLEKAYRDPVLMADIRAQALRKGITLGVIDAASAVFGGKILKGAGTGATKAQKVVAGAKSVGFEMATEAGGEAASQAAQYEGDLAKVDVGSSLQEGFTSLGQTMASIPQHAAVRGEFAIRAQFSPEPAKAAHEVVQVADQSIKALQGAQQLEQIGAAIKETKNLKEVPAKVAELVQASTGGQGATSVFYQTDDFDNYWKSKGESPAEKAGEIMGDGGKAYQDAKNTGGQLEIPLEQFASVVGPTEHFEGLLPVTRTEAGGITVEEAKENLIGLPSMMKQLSMEAVGVTTTEEEVVEEKAKGIGPRIQQQLVEAGRPVREAKQAAKLVEKSFANIAKRMGMNSEQFDEFIQQYLPNVAPAETAAPQQGTQTLNQESNISAAQAAGYDTSKKLYHGGVAKIESFRTNNKGANKYLEGVYMTPLKGDAERYAEIAESGSGSSQLYEFYAPQGMLALDDDASVDAAIQKMGLEIPKLKAGQIYKYNPEMTNLTKMRKAVENSGVKKSQVDTVLKEKLQAAGFPGMFTENDQVTVVFDPKKVKATNAEFAKEDGNIYSQGDPNSPAGQIRFGDKRINIDLLATANPSTFLHEMGHAYLKIMSDLSSKADAPQSVKEDMDAIYKWLNVDKANQTSPRTGEVTFTVDQHEQFARGFEAYLREGKSPSTELRSAFAAFKTWLVSWYKSATQLNVQLTDEVRGVFDRIIAAEEEIADAHGFISSRMNILDIPQDKQVEYLEKVTQWKEEAEQKLTQKLLTDMEKKDTQAYKAMEKQVRAAVESEVNDMKIYKVISYLKDFTMPNGTKYDSGMPEYRLDKKLIKKLFPEGTVAKLRGMTAEAGGKYAVVDPSVVAGLFGYNSGRTLVQALTEAPTRESVIEMMTEQRMQEQFSDMMFDEQARFSEAIKIVHEEKGAQVKRMEFDMIAERMKSSLKEGIKMLSYRLPTDKQIKAEAARIIRDTNHTSVRPIAYLRAERQNAKQAGILFTQGKFEEALAAKRRELYNYELYKAAQQFNEAKKKELKFFKKIMSSKSEDIAKTRDVNFVDAAKAVIAKYTGDTTKKSPEQHLELMKQYHPDGYESMMNLIGETMSPKESFDDMTVEEFSAVADTIHALWDLSKTSKEIIVAGKKVEIETAISELVEQSEKFRKEGLNQKYNRTATDREKTNTRLLGIKAFLQRFESWVDVMDMGDVRGKFREYIYGEVSKAEDQYRRTRKEYKQRLIELSKPIKEKMDLTKPITSEELGFEFKNKAEVLGALLHSGNESNLQKLLLGYKWATISETTGELDTSKWDAFIDRMISEGVLTKEDFDYIQALWDINEEIKPMAQRAFRKVFGYNFDSITSMPFSKKFGDTVVSYRGGYAPAKVDPYAVTDHKQRNELEQFVQGHQAFTYPASGNTGWTKKRVAGYNKPLHLDIGLVVKHVEDVLRFAIIKPAVVDSAKIVLNPGFREQMMAINPKFGVDIDKMIVPALNRADKGTIQNADPAVPAAAMRFFNVLKNNAAMQLMVGNVVNTLEQFAGPLVAATRISPAYLMKGMYSYMISPKRTATEIQELSQYMKNRTDDQMFEIDKQAGSIFEEKTTLGTMREFALKHGYVLQQVAQHAIDNAVWKSSYDESLAKGLTAEQAIDKADADVRLTQSSRRAMDVANLETNSILGFFQMFMGFFNTMLNLNAANFEKLYFEDIGMKKKFSKGFYLYMMGFASLAVVSGALRKAAAGGLDEDDDDEYLDDLFDVFIGSQVSLATAMVPVVGTATMAGLNAANDKQFDDRVSASPAMSALTTVVGTAVKAVDGDLWDSKKVKADTRDALTALGIVTGVPVGAVNRPVSYEIDRQKGKAKPTGPLDAARGYITGKPGVRD